MSVPQQSNLAVKRYCFGKGGGFTGDYTEFSYDDDGKVYKRDFSYDRDIYYKDLSIEDLNYFAEQFESLGLGSEYISQPGNISYYIEVRVGESSSNKIVWGHIDYRVDENIESLFNEVYEKLSARP